MLVLIVMLCMSTAVTGFVMGKDAERNISVKAATHIASTIEPTSNYVDTRLKATLEIMKLDNAPSVVGMKENTAMNKLQSAKVDTKKIQVTHEKMTYPELVEKSDTLFFGEVKNQTISAKGIGLVVVDADMDDPFTAEMHAMGSRLAWPVPGNERISSHFGNRASPGGIGSTNHKGIDIPAPTGKPIISVKTGIVESAGRMGGYGNCVVVDHENGFKSLYGHMSAITCNAGDRVKPGDVIGKVGSTGWSTGPHLHFSLIKNGTYIDPEPFFTGKENVNAGDEVSVNTTDTEDPNKEETNNSNRDTDPSGENQDSNDEPSSSESGTSTDNSQPANNGNGNPTDSNGSSGKSGDNPGTGGGDTQPTQPSIPQPTTGGSGGGNTQPTQPSTTQPTSGGSGGGNNSGSTPVVNSPPPQPQNSGSE